MKLGLLLSEIIAAQELCEHYEISNECIAECAEEQTSCLGKKLWNVFGYLKKIDRIYFFGLSTVLKLVSIETKRIWLYSQTCTDFYIELLLLKFYQDYIFSIQKTVVMMLPVFIVATWTWTTVQMTVPVWQTVLRVAMIVPIVAVFGPRKMKTTCFAMRPWSTSTSSVLSAVV